MTEEIDFMGCMMYSYTRNFRHSSEIIRTRAYLKSQFGLIFKHLIAGIPSPTVETLIDKRPIMAEQWTGAVVRIMQDTPLVQRMCLALGGNLKDLA